MYTADFHIHSKYSRATSKDCVPELLDLWARRKGLDLIGTGDFTHPVWRAELADKLVPAEDGLYALREELRLPGEIGGGGRPTRFVVTGEISSIYKKNGRVRKIHNLILLPGLEEAATLSRRLEQVGNLHSDGRPILGLDARDLLEITLEACPRAVFIPAHIWTPHFSLFGAYSGFDDIEECFGDLTGQIHALETGLSSNPPMNWRLSALDRFVLVSNSDAHSPANLAREANLFDTDLSFDGISRALSHRDSGGFGGTLEFFPEEGKYHFNGHRNCGVCQSPEQTLAANGLCPACGGKVTLGVSHRVEELADRPEGYAPDCAGHFESLVPLPEVIAASTGFSPKSIKGRAVLDGLLRELGPELHILRTAAVGDVEQAAGPALAEGLRRLRCGELQVTPGYDGAYGRVRILSPEEMEQFSGQMRLFSAVAPAVKKPVKKAGSGAGAKQARPRDPGAAYSAPQPELNPKQRAAACSHTPVTAVVAGPGTGKTKTLVSRIAHLIRERGAPPSTITAVTFTNKAAAEMRRRLEQGLGGKRTVGRVSIGTFHALSLELLRQTGPEEAVADEATALSMLEDLVRESGCQLSAGEVRRRISLQKCGVSDQNAVCPPELYRAYCDLFASYGAMDYDDILLRALELAETWLATPDLGPKSPFSRFSHLLVDEFQDCNPVQYRLVRAWVRGAQKLGGGGSLFVIGDPNQSIYGFRGSDPRCFDWLRTDSPGLLEVSLERNYRSTAQILKAAAPVVSGCASPLLTAQRADGAKVRLIHADTPFSEAVFVAKEINRMVGGIDMLDSDASPAHRGVHGFSDIAVLYRTNRQAALLEDCLVQEGIPYVVAGRDDLLSHPNTAKLLAFFHLVLEPANLLSLRSCLQALPDGTPAQTARVLMRYRESPRDLSALEDVLTPLPGGQQLAALLRRYAPMVRKTKPQKLLTLWAEQEAGEDERWTDRLLHTAVFHETMEDFLQAMALGQEGDIRRYGGKRYTGDAVSLMTLHGAKGLEYPAVFVCGFCEGMIPHIPRGQRRTLQEEERRLLYVGMTRARDRLILCSPGAPSPFLEDLPRETLEIGQAVQRKLPPQHHQFSLFD